MEKQEALDLVLAHTVCCSDKLNCIDHCPLYKETEEEDEISSSCCQRDWTEEDMANAVKALIGYKIKGEEICQT